MQTSTDNMSAQDYAHNIKNSAAGLSATFAGVGVSMMEIIEQWLRVGGLAVGLAIGLISLYNLVRGRQK